MMNSFDTIIQKYRRLAFSERDKGARFERLMRAYLATAPEYSGVLKDILMWEDFPFRKDFGGKDIGIDLVAQTFSGDYWAIQCKCYEESAVIDKPAVDSFLSTSSRTFLNEQAQTTGFAHRLWISTTSKWGSNAEETIRNQNPPVSRIDLSHLDNAPVDWEKLDKGIFGEAARSTRKRPFPHQQEATQKTVDYFSNAGQYADRGKLIMACGTGKTYTSLQIAENLTGGKGSVLFFAPSIALIGQTLREWAADAKEPINAICICSDPEISKQKKKNDDDQSTYSIVDLALPASTRPDHIIHQFYRYRDHNKGGMTVVFSTYQSIDVISKAQKDLLEHGFPEFDLIICDEAHRTTGVTLAGAEESEFVKVHDNKFIRAKKRLYMTATPRLYSDDAKSKAAQYDAELCSMDDPEKYGEEIYRIGFGNAVEKDLLSDYKVLILTLNETDIPPALQSALTGETNEISTDDASKLIGCINALSKQIIGDEGSIKTADPGLMQRAVAFCPKIVDSKSITGALNTFCADYTKSLSQEDSAVRVSVAAKHIDGTMNAPERDGLLSWLKHTPEEKECRILTNVRCLSEGIDVPSLDAVLFLSPRNSQIDVVQSVGRVMRKAPNKKYGYIIIPVVIPSNINANEALDDNERFKVVWTVLNALRAHDDRFNATVNKIELNKKRPGNIIVGKIPKTNSIGTGNGDKRDDTEAIDDTSNPLAEQLTLQFEELQGVIFGRMVQKVGDRHYWEQWAKSVGEIAVRFSERITRLIGAEGEHKKAFGDFLAGLQKNINPSIQERDAIEMLSQHIITRPVFEALFDDYSFVKNNAISVSMQNILDTLENNAVDKDTETLEKFYEFVKRNVAKLDNAAAKQSIIVRLYDNFFKIAFPKMVERLGIVYTPVEIVDFIIHSVDDILKAEFGRSLSDENVNILDPFTGTGTFITRLLQSGLIRKADLSRKYEREIFANEIVLLAYYIAAVNIENAYHDAAEVADYTPFGGICLTDTFQLGETDDSAKLFSELFKQNSERVQRLTNRPLTVIFGNPPYSIGQKSANDNAQNQNYPKLKERIEETYVKASNANLSKSAYDSYIKAFRWSTDRLDPKNGGIIAFITNSGWLESNGLDGFRTYLEKEFSQVYIFNLRGAVRGRAGEAAKKEGQNVFNIMTGVAITLLIKNPKRKTDKAIIKYYDIGDYLSHDEKLAIVKKLYSVVSPDLTWKWIKPNEHGDWINQRNDVFSTLIPLEPEKKFDVKAQSFFTTIAIGVASNRDVWVYNFSKTTIENNMRRMIDFYNQQRKAFAEAEKQNPDSQVEDFIDTNPAKISWTRALRRDIKNDIQHSFKPDELIIGTYRPFQKQWLYYDRLFIESPGVWSNLFPTPKHENLVICLTGLQERRGFAALIINTIPDLNNFDGGTQCFPLHYYEEQTGKARSLFDKDTEYTRRDGVSDFIFDRARKQYGKNVTKEDIFYYVYGFLHSPDYRKTFANDLKKMLPRLPLVDNVRDFLAFSKAGRALAELHLNYETVPPCTGVSVAGDESNFYTVEKMRFPRKGQTDTIIYNSRITVSSIPAAAYEYIVNGKSAVEWIMERYQVKIDKDSGIKNDPNDWAKEHNKPRYILDLLLSVIEVSIKTVEIVGKLPKVEFEGTK